MSTPRTFRGFSLLEVLIALLIFSFGLLGLAGLMVMSVKTNHSAFLRTQASFLAQSMSDRMRANTRAVWDGTYSATYNPASPAVTSDPCASGAACSYTNVANRDIYFWTQMLGNSLPGASATIACTQTAGSITPILTGTPPYNGLCTMTLSWSEATLKRTAGATPDKQTFVWVFQP